MKIRTIAMNTFKEAARNKIFYLLLFFAVFFIIGSKVISFLTVGDREKIIIDMGLASINFFSVMVAIFTGINLVFKEIEKKTIFNILSKPVKRSDFILGKFFGLGITTLVSLSVMGLIFFLFLLINSVQIVPLMILYFAYMYVELLIIISISILFSSFSTPILSSIFTISIYLIGHVVWTFNTLKDRIAGGFEKTVFYLTYYIFPNLEKFNLKSSVLTAEMPGLNSILLTLLYGLFFTSGVLFLSIVIFSKREF